MTITQQLTALGHPVRWHMLQLLLEHDGSLCVDDLTMLIGKAMGYPYNQSTISHHLRILNQAGFLSEERNSNYHFYHVRLETVKEVEQALAHLHSERKHTPCNN